ncbi:MFS transporter [Streptomyces sp. NA02950]|uniref:MFS transporter n=1 Tax=Streptomyces sp. NA02950 TaxID=2742137 RepID=UPI001591E1C1|nr:MFS transporter [Streptomyces sp. NA02950]QKV96648.1 MFS transporter [Streptomyces sp. NA02950]
MTMSVTPAGRTTRATVEPAAIPEQRRVLAVLVTAQILSGAGMAAGITVGALLAEEMLGTTGLAGLPAALFTSGAALGAMAIGRLSQRWGRRPGLALGYATAATGSVGVVVAGTVDSVPLLFLSLVLYGAGSATNLLARYAGADLAPPERRGRAVSRVLLATTFGAVLGPNLVGVTGDLAHSWAMPRLVGPFLLAAVAYALGGCVLAGWLRPDPLRLARELAERRAASETGDMTGEGAAGPETLPAAGPVMGEDAGGRSAPGVLTGATVMVVGQLVMIAIMTMTPVHMTGHGHSTQAAGLVIALHVGAMFLPSPLSGLLVDRVGRLRVAAVGSAVLLSAGLLAALASPHSLPALATALVLLGLGWNLGLVSATAIITDAVPLDSRAATQGLVDVGVAIAGTTGGLASGLVVAGSGYGCLAAGGGILSLTVIPVLALTTRPRPRPRT